MGDARSVPFEVSWCKVHTHMPHYRLSVRIALLIQLLRFYSYKPIESRPGNGDMKTSKSPPLAQVFIKNYL